MPKVLLSRVLSFIDRCFADDNARRDALAADYDQLAIGPTSAQEAAIHIAHAVSKFSLQSDMTVMGSLVLVRRTFERRINQRSPKRANHCRCFMVSAIIEDAI